MYYEDSMRYEGVECLPTHYLQEIPYSVSDTYYTVPPSKENRLDIISNDHYGIVSLWWVIALASDIRDPFKVPQGTVLRIPPLSTLFYIRGTGLEG